MHQLYLKCFSQFDLRPQGEEDRDTDLETASSTVEGEGKGDEGEAIGRVSSSTLAGLARSSKVEDHDADCDDYDLKEEQPIYAVSPRPTAQYRTGGCVLSLGRESGKDFWHVKAEAGMLAKNMTLLNKVSTPERRRRSVI
jgi:hypothetical protein